MPITRDEGVPELIGALVQKFNQCCEGYSVADVVTATTFFLAAGIVKQGEGMPIGPFTDMLNTILNACLASVMQNRNRQPRPTDIPVPPQPEAKPSPHASCPRPESEFPTFNDYAAAIADLIARGLGELPASVLVVPDSTMQACARIYGSPKPGDKPAIMMDFERQGGRLAACLLSDAQMTGNQAHTTNH